MVDIGLRNGNKKALCDGNITALYIMHSMILK